MAAKLHQNLQAPGPPAAPAEGPTAEVDGDAPTAPVVHDAGGNSKQSLELGQKVHLSDQEEYPFKTIPLRDRIAGQIAYILLALLGGTVLLHYLMTAIFIVCFREKYEPIGREFDKVFNNLLPILSGLVGSAVTYYFTRDNRST